MLHRTVTTYRMKEVFPHPKVESIAQMRDFSISIAVYFTLVTERHEIAVLLL